MSDTFNDREKAFENKFKLDEELEFKVNARAVHAFGLWAAQQLGMDGADAEAYAQEVMDSDFTTPGIDDFIAKVRGDLEGRNIATSAHQLENQFNALREAALKSLMIRG